MLSKCLNPTCSAPFRYLRDGRIFQLGIPAPEDSGAARRREYFWLCGRCCASFTVVVKDGTGAVKSRVLELSLDERLEQGEEEQPIPSRSDTNPFGP
ncbi:MAG: hypothetical protein WA628_02725 [Terriglobales bacterium]